MEFLSNPKNCVCHQKSRHFRGKGWWAAAASLAQARTALGPMAWGWDVYQRLQKLCTNFWYLVLLLKGLGPSSVACGHSANEGRGQGMCRTFIIKIRKFIIKIARVLCILVVAAQWGPNTLHQSQNQGNCLFFGYCICDPNVTTKTEWGQWSNRTDQRNNLTYWEIHANKDTN